MNIRKYQGIKPEIAKRVYIDKAATVIGKVFLAEDVSVWPQAVLRGDVGSINIGSRTSIQDGSVLHVTHDGPYSPGGQDLTIGADVTVGHSVTLHACAIADAVLIGIGSIVLDAAVIPRHTLIGAGSLVPPGKELAGGYLWLGNPVKQIRKLTTKEIDFFYYSAKHYVKLKDLYLSSSD